MEKASFLLLLGAPWELCQAPSSTPGPGTRSETAKAEDGTILQWEAQKELNGSLKTKHMKMASVQFDEVSEYEA